MVQTCRRPWSSHRYKHSQRIVDVTVAKYQPSSQYRRWCGLSVSVSRTIQSVQKMVWTLSVSISIDHELYQLDVTGRMRAPIVSCT